MADTRTSDNRTLHVVGEDDSRVAANHLVAGAVFLVLGGGLKLLSLMSLRFADIFPITYGRLEPMANLTLMIGFVSISLIGGIYYVLPRLTGARLRGSSLAKFELIGIAVLVLVGLLAIGLGFGTGGQPFGLPWWINLPMALLLAVPALVTIGTISDRTENRSYVTLWFVLGGVIWLPLLYLAFFSGDLPSLSSTAVAYTDVFFSAGFVTMFLLTVGTGLFYYTMVRELDVSLASRQLALVGFWSLGFAAVWWGTAQLMFGPGPSYLSGVGAALGLAFPIGAQDEYQNEDRRTRDCVALPIGGCPRFVFVPGKGHHRRDRRYHRIPSAVAGGGRRNRRHHLRVRAGTESTPGTGTD